MEGDAAIKYVLQLCFSCSTLKQKSGTPKGQTPTLPLTLPFPFNGQRLYLFFFLFSFCNTLFNWSMGDLQHRVNFSCTAKWFSFIHTHAKVHKREKCWIMCCLEEFHLEENGLKWLKTKRWVYHWPVDLSGLGQAGKSIHEFSMWHHSN